LTSSLEVEDQCKSCYRFKSRQEFICRLLQLQTCPHCRRKVRLSQKTARQQRQSPNSATDTFLRQCGQALMHPIADRYFPNIFYNLKFENWPKNIDEVYKRNSTKICHEMCPCVPNYGVLPPKILEPKNFELNFATSIAYVFFYNATRYHQSENGVENCKDSLTLW